MHARAGIIGCCLLYFALGQPVQPLSAAEPAATVDFNRDIKPILSNNCYQCHGPDEAERKGATDGLRLDTFSGATADLGGFSAIVPGHPEESGLIERIAATDDSLVMPPRKTGKKLTPGEIKLLTDWVQQGARYSQHWSYVKPVRPQLPAVQNSGWPKTEVDRFLLARLEREGLQPAPVADRYALIRRVSLDLTGLPPTLEEVDAFVNDESPQAYEKLVDRLLQKQSYGEHWAHLWLDLARYADSAGYADDPARTIWLYRDYVIRSLNANKPFDQFTIEQIAGDLLPNPTEDQLIATAFHRNTLTNSEGGTNDEEFRNVAIVDRVNTTLAVWMGTTIACAQCHTHKYDPLSQAEFFQLFAFFNNSEDADRRDEAPLLSYFTSEQRQQRTQWETDIARLEQTVRTATPELTAAQTQWEQSFPLDLQWHTPRPAEFKSQGNLPATISADNSILVSKAAATDTYTIDLPLGATTLRALRLETLPDDSLPSKGAGHAGGNFVLSRVSAVVTPPADQPITGRYVRIELPGPQKFLSLAEVQVFHGDQNLATAGEARQVSTDFGGDAKRAIDGNTDGRYNEASSTSHTALEKDPWWEVDLKSPQAVDRVLVWNRTDPGLGERLSNFKVLLLNDQRETVWETTVAAAPAPSTALALSGARTFDIAAAVADYTQPGFAADAVINPKAPKNEGWSVGGQPNQPHALILIAKTPLEISEGSRLTVTLDQQFKTPNHTLGRFRLSVTEDARAGEWGSTPAAILAALQVPDSNRTEAQRETIAAHYRSIAPALAPQRQQLAALRKQLSEQQPVTVPIMRELAEAQRRVTKIQHRGNFLDLGDEVTAGTPEVFHPLPADVPRNRLALARWLVDENNPLTARVIANRYWEQFFGIGIVSTSEEFGAQGEQPFHPELLDYLATELIRLNWDMKAFVKLLVTSAAYRQSSQVTPELQQRDPDNRLLARGPRFRLSAESIRDQSLFVAGLLSPKMYGPPVKPPQPAIGLSAAFGSGIDWQTSAGEDKYRRALYTTWRRSNPYPSMSTFDAPNREVCTVRRGRTNTPLQALVTLNDPVYIEAAQALARRIAQQPDATSLSDRLQFGFRLCLSRPASSAEIARLARLYENSRAWFEQHPAEAAKLATDPLGPPPADTPVPDLAAWTTIANVLLNLDETLMKR